MDWIEVESVWFICPGLTDVFVWGEALQGLEPACEIVGHDEVGQVVSELAVRLIVIAVNGCLLNGAVHPFDLAVRPRMVGFSQAVLDAVGSADHRGVLAAVADLTLALMGLFDVRGCSGTIDRRSLPGR